MGIVTREEMLDVHGRVLPGSGNLPNGEPTLSAGFWTVPFKRDGFGWQVSFRDRSITGEADRKRAAIDLLQEIHRALIASDVNPY